METEGIMTTFDIVGLIFLFLIFAPLATVR